MLNYGHYSFSCSEGITAVPLQVALTVESSQSFCCVIIAQSLIRSFKPC
jgi:hypothetical protein